MTPTSAPSFADRFCNACRWLGFGSIFGFMVCMLVIDAGYSVTNLQLILVGIVAPLVVMLIILPRAVIELARWYRQHHQLSRRT